MKLFRATPCSRLFLEKLVVPELVKGFPHFTGPRLYFCVHKGLLLVPVLSQMNPFHTLLSRSVSMGFVVDK